MRLRICKTDKTCCCQLCSLPQPQSRGSVAQLQRSRVGAVLVCRHHLGGELAAALASLGLLDGQLAAALEGSTLREEEVVHTPQQLVLNM